jgi:hypothetical protein
MVRPYEQIRDGAAAFAAAARVANTTSQYGAVELDGPVLDAPAREPPRSSSGAVLAVILALLGVLLTGLTIAASYTAPPLPGDRLQAAGPAATAREGGWEVGELVAAGACYNIHYVCFDPIQQPIFPYCLQMILGHGPGAVAAQDKWDGEQRQRPSPRALWAAELHQDGVRRCVL